MLAIQHKCSSSGVPTAAHQYPYVGICVWMFSSALCACCVEEIAVGAMQHGMQQAPYCSPALLPSLQCVTSVMTIADLLYRQA